VVLDTIQSRAGLLALLNEECLRPGGSDNSFASKFISAFVKKDSPVKRDRKVDHKFVVVHYAEEVCYDVTGWCEKNKDALLADMVTILRASQNAVVTLMFTARKKAADDEEPAARPGRARGSSLNVNTVAMQFKKQVQSLMNDIKQTTVQYIRCIKPNKTKSAVDFDRAMVVLQLRSAGVVEAIRMSRAAFPNRLLATDFIQRFKLIMPGGSKAATDAKRVADALLKIYCVELAAEAAKAKGGAQPLYAAGKTKIFFVKGVLEALEAARLKGLDGKIVKIQSWARMLKCKKEFVFQRQCAGSIVKLQTHFRMINGKRRWKLRLQYVVKAQAAYRGRLGCRKVARIRAEKEAAAEALAATKKKDAEEQVKAAKNAAEKEAAKKAEEEAKKAEEEVQRRHKEKVIADQKTKEKKAEAEKKAADALKETLEAEKKAKAKRDEVRKHDHAGGNEYEVNFGEGPLGIWFTGQTVTDMDKAGQAKKLGVIKSSTVVAINDEVVKSVFEVSNRAGDTTRPLKMRFRKPTFQNVVASRKKLKGDDVDIRSLQYDVTFVDGSLGLELDRHLVVKCLEPGAQAQKGGVRVGSKIAQVRKRVKHV
jgi:myosin-5